MGNKKILIVCQYAQEPPYNTMLRYHNWGKELIKRGYDVSILAASVVHNTSIDMVDINKGNTSSVDGIKYYYINTQKYSGNGIKRLINMYQFCTGIKSFKKTLSPDLVIICGAYPFFFVKHAFKKVPIITDIVDLWPLSIVEYANISNNNPFIKFLYDIERQAYIKSDALVFSMEGGKDYVSERKYAKKVQADKIFHINMGIDIAKNDENKQLFSQELPWDESLFNIGYCGSIRQANNVKQICDAAYAIQEKGYKDISFQIYGNGDELESLKAYCNEKKIENISFYGRIEKEKIPYILSRMKANILTYKQVGLMRYGGSQSKLFDYLAAGRPIICNAKFGYNLITRYECGIVTETQSSEAFVDSIEKLYKMDKEQTKKMGDNARKVAEQYDQPALVDKLEEVFKYLEK